MESFFVFLITLQKVIRGEVVREAELIPNYLFLPFSFYLLFVDEVALSGIAAID